MFIYKLELGIWGNLQRIFIELTNTSNQTINNKASYDVDHISMEQALTEADLNNIIAEQTITDLDIRVMELEAK